MIKKALITGINGFVGPYLKTKLEKHDLKVFGLDRNRQHCDEKHIFCTDILDFKKLEKCISEIQPDYFFHLAGQSSVQRSFENPQLTHKINVDGTKNIYEIANNIDKKVKIILVSSCQIYSNPHTLPIKETEELKASSPYAKSRIEQEKIPAHFPKIETVIMRSFNHIGPNQSPEFVIPNFAKQIVEIKKGLREPIIRTGNLSAIRDFSDVRDIVTAYFLAATKGRSGQIYNVGSGQGYSILDLLKKMLDIAEVKATLITDEDRLRPLDIPRLICDHQLFTNDTGWKPQYNIATSLKDIINFWVKSI